MHLLSALYHKLPIIATAPFCPLEIRETVPISRDSNLFERFRRYAGIGLLVSVGYMDPGNWATDIEVGSRYGYGLLFVVLLASLAAMLLQTLCVRLGIASGKDLVQLCREHFHSKINIGLWLFAEIAIVACDFAEVLGTALALKLLFYLPLAIGIVLTAFDTIIVLLLQGKGVLRVEAIVMGLVATISAAFFAEIVMSKPEWGQVLQGFIPAPAPGSLDPLLSVL
jgi:manganese transport protein